MLIFIDEYLNRNGWDKTFSTKKTAGSKKYIENVQRSEDMCVCRKTGFGYFRRIERKMLAWIYCWLKKVFKYNRINEIIVSEQEGSDASGIFGGR